VSREVFMDGGKHSGAATHRNYESKLRNSGTG
jgi:hypothetical protein